MGTAIIALIPGFLSALVAIPKIGVQIEAAAAAVVLWYVKRAKGATLAAIADAAALGARAQTDEERYQAAAKWQAALQRPKVTT